MSREQHYAALHYRVVSQIGATFYTAKVTYPPHPDIPCAKRKETIICCPNCNIVLTWKTRRSYKHRAVDVWHCPTCKRLFSILDDTPKPKNVASSKKTRKKHKPSR